MAGKRPARLTYGSGECCINVDRIQDYYVKDGNGHVTAECGLGINPGKAVDRTMFVLKVDGPEGDTIGFFLNYPMHNCVMIQNPCGRDGKPAVSSDVGGAVCRYLEEAYGGSVALWTSGAAGDINPVMGNEIYYPDIKTGRQTRLILKNGEMARAALKNLSARQYADVCQVIRHLPSYKENTELHGRIDWIRIPSEDSEGRPMDTSYEVRMHLLKIGDLALIGASGELYSSLGTALKAVSDAGETVIINHDCSLMVPSGYIFDDETWNGISGAAFREGKAASWQEDISDRRWRNPAAVLKKVCSQKRRLLKGHLLKRHLLKRNPHENETGTSGI